MSRLATVVGALSAIVTLVDYLAAKSFLSHWLQRQISRDGAGWRITPTMNLLFITVLVGLIWLATDSPATEPVARKRLFRLRAQLVMCSLAAWFLLGPSIGEVEIVDASAHPDAHATRWSSPVSAGHASGELAREIPPPAIADPAPSALLVGHTSQFTWRRPVQPTTINGAWEPGRGLRAMARVLDSASATPPPQGR